MAIVQNGGREARGGTMSEWYTWFTSMGHPIPPSLIPSHSNRMDSLTRHLVTCFLL